MFSCDDLWVSIFWGGARAEIFNPQHSKVVAGIEFDFIGSKQISYCDRLQLIDGGTIVRHAVNISWRRPLGVERISFF